METTNSSQEQNDPRSSCVIYPEMNQANIEIEISQNINSSQNPSQNDPNTEIEEIAADDRTDKQSVSLSNSSSSLQTNRSNHSPNGTLTPNLNLNANTFVNSEKKYGVGITGIDRIILPNYSFKGKLIWCIFYIIFFITFCWQTTGSFSEYFYGQPAVSVNVETSERYQVPQYAACPVEMTGKNVITEALRKEYINYFNVTEENRDDIVFSDFIRLPNQTMDSLWDLYDIFHTPFNETTTMCFEQDNGTISCGIDLIKNKKVTARGTCLTNPDDNLKMIVENDGHLWHRITKKMSKKWSVFDFVMRLSTVTPPRSFMYSDVDYGVPNTPAYHVSVSLIFIEIFRLNLPHRPCVNDFEGTCIESCIEEMLYSEVPCRLPFMTNFSLPDCQEPDLFNKSMTITRKVMKKVPECEDKCPILCYQTDITGYNELMRVLTEEYSLWTQVLNPRKTVVKEEYWYTFTNLFADVGGGIGVFLDINVLTVFELIEVIIEFVYTKWKIRKQVSPIEPKKKSFTFRCSRRNRHIAQLFSTYEDYDILNIGLDGFDRILSSNCSKTLKIFWSLCVSLSFCVCILQINSMCNDLQYGKPDVRLLPVFNKTLKYPSLSLCPFRPFTHWDFFSYLRELYADERNITRDIDKIPLSELINVEVEDIMEFWNKSIITEKNVNMIDKGLKKLSNIEDDDEKFEVSYESSLSVFGRCLTMHFESQVQFKGIGTLFLMLLELGMIGTTYKYAVQLFVHLPEDDVRTLDQRVGIPVLRGVAGSFPTIIRRIERLSYFEHPCADSSVVAKCRSDCFEKTIMEQVSCRLPFIKNQSLPLCNTSQGFNQIMTVVQAFYDNFSHTWCQCPQKCFEYIYDVIPDEMTIPVDMTALIFQIPSNLILVLQEYRQMGLMSVFGSICGSLGLYLGFSLLTLLECFEFFWILMKRIKRKFFNK